MEPSPSGSIFLDKESRKSMNIMKDATSRASPGTTPVGIVDKLSRMSPPPTYHHRMTAQVLLQRSMERASYNRAEHLSTPRPLYHPQSQPKFLDREKFLERQTSDQFCIMNLLDPKTFQDGDSVSDNSLHLETMLYERGISAVERENRSSTSPQDSFHESADAFPSLFQKSTEQVCDKKLEEEVMGSLSNLLPDPDLSFFLNVTENQFLPTQGESERKSKREKKEKRDRKERKERKGTKKKKSKEKKTESVEGHTSTSASIFSEKTRHVDDKSMLSLPLEDLRKSERARKKSSKLSKSLPVLELDHGLELVKQHSRTKRKTSRRRRSDGDDHDTSQSVGSGTTESWRKFTKHEIRKISDRALVQVKTTKLEASEFEDNFSESCWSDDDNNESIMDSDSGDVCASQISMVKQCLSPGADNGSSVRRQPSIRDELRSPYRCVPLPRHGSLDQSAHSTLSAKSQEIIDLRISPSRVPSRSALSMPQSLGPSSYSPSSDASHGSVGTGMSASIATRSIKSRDGSHQRSGFMRESISETTVTTVETSGHGDGGQQAVKTPIEASQVSQTVESINLSQNVSYDFDLTHCGKIDQELNEPCPECVGGISTRATRPFSFRSPGFLSRSPFRGARLLALPKIRLCRKKNRKNG